MICPLCGTRKIRRACPGVGHDICPVCCGTKRLVEIRCPADCVYLTTARAHPPAAVVRQRDRDFRFAVPMVHQLSEGAYRLLMLLQIVIRQARPGAVPPLVDTDVAAAVATLAATLETTARGIIYEHPAPTIPAARLVAEMTRVLTEIRRQAPTVDRDAILALRRLEDAARRAPAELDGGDTALLDFIERLPRELNAALEAGTRPSAPAPEAPRIIVP